MPALAITVRDNGTEAPLVLRRRDERTDHPAEVPWLSVIQNVQPEVVAFRLSIASQITKVFSQHKRGIVLRLTEVSALGQLTHPNQAARLKLK